ncbi:two-component hybrid sensor and regulator, partial [Candidatus Thiomargarita nelsonii]
PQEHRENIGIINRSGEHLLMLINQVLDLSKIEAGRITLNKQNFDFYRLLDDVEDMFQLRADDKHLQLLVDRSPDVPQYVQTDEVKLRQVLINLLNNAIKFTQEGGVSLRVSSEAGALRFEIEDTGPGIAPDELDNLFEAFVQTAAGKLAEEGTGLGLAISRQFVQLMGGDMTVSSEVGKGTTFKFEIAIRVVKSSDIQSQQTSRQVIALAPGQSRYRILIVDDKHSNRQLLLKLLGPLGFEVRDCCNGVEAIEIWEHWQPHLIWMDMRMPVMDGYEATQRIKATFKGHATTIIALTASAFEEERAAVLSAGCDDFMRKPFKETDIFEMMHKHIG